MNLDYTDSLTIGIATEIAAGPNWIFPFKDVSDVADLCARFAKYHIELSDAVVVEAIELVKSNGVRELTDANLGKVAGGSGGEKHGSGMSQNINSD